MKAYPLFLVYGIGESDDDLHFDKCKPKFKSHDEQKTKPKV
jgi:hypothetical protein